MKGPDAEESEWQRFNREVMPDVMKQLLDQSDGKGTLLMLSRDTIIAVQQLSLPSFQFTTQSMRCH